MRPWYVSSPTCDGTDLSSGITSAIRLAGCTRLTVFAALKMQSTGWPGSIGTTYGPMPTTMSNFGARKRLSRGVVAEITAEFDVPLMVSRGFSSGSYLRQAAETITAVGKPTFIYQLGDHDPSGLWITEQVRRDLQRHIKDIGEFDLDDFCFERIAVTPKQIEDWRLPTRPTKREGNTHAKNFDGDSVELDAIPIPRLHHLLRDCIEQHIDQHQLKVLRTAEKSERELLFGLAGVAP
jgi:hypothetical protein